MLQNELFDPVLPFWVEDTRASVLNENFRCAPRRPDGDGVHASVAAAASQRVMLPCWTSARSYSGQFPSLRYVTQCFPGCEVWHIGAACTTDDIDRNGIRVVPELTLLSARWSCRRHGALVMARLGPSSRRQFGLPRPGLRGAGRSLLQDARAAQHALHAVVALVTGVLIEQLVLVEPPHRKLA